VNDNCNKIVALYNHFTYDDFVKWNPAVGATCGGIWADTWYCVGILGTPTIKPTITTASITVQTQTSTQRPTPTGLLCILKFVNGAYYYVGTFPFRNDSYYRANLLNQRILVTAIPLLHLKPNLLLSADARSGIR
jgi:hypothetical protein